MNTTMIVSSFLFLSLLFILAILKLQLLQAPITSTTDIFMPSSITKVVDTIPVTTENTTNGVCSSEGKEAVWWNALENMDQLGLALMLTQKGLPVWEKYASLQDIIYSHSRTGPTSKINRLLLQNAIDDIILQSQIILPGCNNKKLNQYYNYFVEPVIALQDGYWVPPYPVKKIFLSVYHILKAILEQNDPASFESLLAISINQSIDCMDITRLYSKTEITAFLKEYKKIYDRKKGFKLLSS